MGTACSTIEGPSHYKNRTTSVVIGLSSFKEHRAFKERYTSSKGPKDDILFITHKDTQCDYICRIISRSSAPCQDMDTITMHFAKLSACEHPHLCKFVEGFEDSNSLYLVYEKADMTTLFKYIVAGQSFAEEDAAEYTRQICMALAVAHEQGLGHGCLNPSKVVILPEDRDVARDDEEDDVPPAQVKICDMGQGLILTPNVLQQLRRPGGKPPQELVECMPPEVAWEEVNDIDYGNMDSLIQKMDIWSLGCIVFHMLTGGPPHSAADQEQLVERLKTQSVEFGEEWSELTPDARDCVESMLKVNAGLRPSASVLLRHPWLRMPRPRLPKKRLLRYLNNVRDYAYDSSFKRMVRRVIAQQLPQDSRTLANAEEAFRFFDRNGDGVLAVQEICRGISKIGVESEIEDLEEIIGVLDRDNSGTVNIQEFLAGSLNPGVVSSIPFLWNAFNAFDRDRDGYSTVDEIESITRNIEAGLLAQEQVDDLVIEIRQELEKVTSSTMDFDQFVYIITSPSHRGLGTTLQYTFYRGMWSACSMDCHNVRHHTTQDWNVQQMSHTPASAYRRMNLIQARRSTPVADEGGQSSGRKHAETPTGGENSRGRRGKQPGQLGKK